MNENQRKSMSEEEYYEKKHPHEYFLDVKRIAHDILAYDC